MTCPSWERLVAHRYGAADDRPPRGWNEALEHLDTCPACREEALGADPTLLFRRMPEERVDAADVESVRAGVDAMRRARRVEAESSLGTSIAGRPPAWRRRGVSSAVRKGRWAAAAAVLAAALLSVHPHGVDRGRPGGAPGAPGPAVAAPSLQAIAARALPGDDIDRPTASVYHFDDEDLALTMVVDPDLDV